MSVGIRLTGAIFCMAIAWVVVPIPARALTCTPGPYIVFFDANAAYVDREGMKVLEGSVEAIGACGTGQLFLAGHTDTREAPNLARKRVQVVRAFFAAHGVPEGDIVVRAFGAKRLRIATSPNVSERQNRRVEILFGPPKHLDPP